MHCNPYIKLVHFRAVNALESPLNADISSQFLYIPMQEPRCTDLLGFLTKSLAQGASVLARTQGDKMGLLWWIIVGMVAGWATGKIMKGSGYGFIVDTVLGIIGAVVGGYLARFLGISPAGGMLYTILIAIGGAVVVVFLFRLISGKR
jgi:uncharacterized membrane protein YeaQ/YmgE (transglycosylase-associated protein family)